MASGNAILAGILSGLGGAGTAIGGAFAQQQKEDLERERLAQERDLRQQALDAQLAQQAQQQSQFEATKAQQQSQFEAGRFTDIPVAMLPASYAGGQADANGNVRVQTSLVPALNKAREDEQVQGRYGALADYLRGRRGSPATAAAAMSPEGSMYSEQEVIPGAPAVAARPVDPNDLVGLLAGVPGGAELAKMILPGVTQKFGIHGGNAAGSPTIIYNQQTGEVMQNIPGVDPGLKAKYTTNTVNTQEGVFRETYDERGQVVNRERVGSPVQQPREPAQPNTTQTILDLTRQRQALQRAGVPDTDRRVLDLNDQIDNIKSYVLAPQGQLVGAGSGAPRATVPGVPSAGERAKMSELDASIAAFTDLAQQARSPAVSGALGLANAPKRFMEDTLKIPTLTDPERAFRAQAAIQLMTVRKSLLGTQQTQLERAGLLPALPSESDPAIAQKLEAWVTAAQRNRAAIEATLGNLNIRTPSPGGSSSVGGSSADERARRKFLAQ